MAITTVKKNISLNVGQPNNFELICAMQDDNKAFEITATIYNGNELYDISGTIRLKGENPVGDSIYKEVDSSTSHTVTFMLTEDMLRYDGLLKLVLVMNGNGTQITTFPFIIKVVNSPGIDNVDSIQSIYELIEEAKRWANLSRSYAVGTDDEVRDGDSTDNSKYYYEQTRELIKGSGFGNGNILYYETYDEFLEDYNSDNIDSETLIVIKENLLISGNQNNNSSNNQENENNNNNSNYPQWSTGTDEEIAALLEKSRNGEVDLYEDCGWRIGDRRAIQIPAFTYQNSEFEFSFPEQTMYLALSVIGDYEYQTPVKNKDGSSRRQCAFQVDQVDSYIIQSSYNSSVWADNIDERTPIPFWSNSILKAYIDQIFLHLSQTIQSFFRPLIIKTIDRGGYNGVSISSAAQIETTYDCLSIHSVPELYSQPVDFVSEKEYENMNYCARNISDSEKNRFIYTRSLDTNPTNASYSNTRFKPIIAGFKYPDRGWNSQNAYIKLFGGIG